MFPHRPGESANPTLEIQSSRQHAWNAAKTRSHKLIRVYVFDSDATDLMVVGTVVQGLVNGKSVSGEWAARILLERGPVGNFKIKLHHVWAVCCVVTSTTPPLYQSANIHEITFRISVVLKKQYKKR
jgi:hypothetical protein